MNKRVLLTGATGFVGHAVAPALRKAGWRVRGLSRKPQEPRAGIEWVQADLADEDALRDAMIGCDAAFYLVHEMAKGGDFAARERESALTFARAAEAAGVQRIVYLGGIEPQGEPSEHLRSRLEVGEILRGGRVPTIELRASMIIGRGSASWMIVRDLAARLPIMVLPSWLRSRTEPIAIHDVVVALTKALDLDESVTGGGSAWFDIPGPEVMTGKDILLRTARALGLPAPKIIEVPLLTPQLSSLWIRLVTRTKWQVAREIVLGLAHDVVSSNDTYWKRIGHERRIGFDEAAHRAIAAEPRHTSGAWGLIERLLGRVHPATPATN